MRWFKKKGLLFSVGLEIAAALFCSLAAILMIMGFIIHVMVAILIAGVIALMAAGLDISI